MSRLLPLFPPVVSSLFYPARASCRVGIAPFILVAILALIPSGFIANAARRRPGLRDALRPNGVRPMVDIVMPLRFGIPANFHLVPTLNVHCDGSGDHQSDGMWALADGRSERQTVLARRKPAVRDAAPCCEGVAIAAGAAPDQAY
jgi:hypothetical protein